jgi:hypothetical protein
MRSKKGKVKCQFDNGAPIPKKIGKGKLKYKFERWNNYYSKKKTRNSDKH